MDEIQRQWFFEDTQTASDVLRRRIHELRTAQGLSQEALAEAMTAVGVPLAPDIVSKIETGARRVVLEELLAFATVLDVPLARLLSPLDGEAPIRAGGIGLERHEVANWMVWGPPTSRATMTAQKRMRRTKLIETMMQVSLDERDPAKRKEHAQEIKRLVEELWRDSGIRPGVMERQALLRGL